MMWCERERIQESLCHSRDFAELLEKDQLRYQMAEKRVFQGFQEGEIDFLPTFKVIAPEPVHLDTPIQVLRARETMYDPKRLPAWCDRILWKSVFSSKKANILSYYSAPEIASSDHKPVAALFRVPTGTSQLRSSIADI